MDGSRRVDGGRTACTRGKVSCKLARLSISQQLTNYDDFDQSWPAVSGVGRSGCMGRRVDEAGGVTPKRPRRFALLAPFPLQSFAGRTHAKYLRTVGIPGEHRLPAHSSFTLQHPDQTCQSQCQHPNQNVRGQGPCLDQREPKQQNRGSHRGSVHYFWFLGATRARPTTAYDGQLSQPYRPGRSSSRSR
jgi:hypothetical protein